MVALSSLYGEAYKRFRMGVDIAVDVCNVYVCWEKGQKGVCVYIGASLIPIAS